MADMATLIYEIDSSAARSAATDLAKLNAASAQAAGGADKLNKTLRDSQGRFRSSYDVAKQYGAEVQSLAAKYNPALNAVYRYQAAQTELNRAVALGVLTQGQANAALTKLQTGMARNISEVEKLRLKYNPLYAASKQFEEQQEELQRALSLGAISVAQYDNALSTLQAGMIRSGGAADQFGKTMAASSQHATNLMFQFQDIGMMLAAGQNPLMLAVQQGSQVAAIFKQMEDSGGDAFGTIKDALESLFSGTSLLTVVAIAGAAALVQWGMSAITAGDAGKTLEGRLSDLENQISVIDQMNRFSSVGGIAAMGEAYGQVTAEIRELIEAQRFVAAEMAKADLAGVIKTLENETGTTFWQSWFGGPSSSVMVAQSIIDAENRVKNLQSTLSLTTNDARSLGFAMDAAFSATNLQDQINKLATVRQYLTLIAQAGGQGAAEATRMLGEITKAEDAARKLLAASGQLPGSFAAAASAAGRIADELNRAVSAAARLAASAVSDVRFAQIELEFRKDPIEKAAAIAAAKFDEEVGKENLSLRWVDAQRKIAVDNARETARILQEVQTLDEADREAARGGSGGGGGGAGARELAAAEKNFQSLRELMEGESMFQVAEWQKRQAQLDQALAQKLISEQNYQLMREQLQMMYFGTEFERNALNYQMDLEQLNAAFEARLLSEEQYLMRRNQLQWDYISQSDSTNANMLGQELGNWAAHFGQMNSLAGGGYDGLLRLQRSFSAASALINTWKAYTDVLASGEVMSPWAKLAWGSKILAAGMGAVNAIKGGGGGGAGAAASSATAATRSEPQRNILVRLEGPDFMVDMAESIMTQIYDQSRDGRVVISRDR